MMPHGESIIALTDAQVSSGYEATDVPVAWCSKAWRFPHIPAVFTLTGDPLLLNHMCSYFQVDWPDFDTLIDRIRHDLSDSLGALMRGLVFYDSSSTIFIGGHSKIRARWETYTLTVDPAIQDTDVYGVSAIESATEVLLAPAPLNAALERYGFAPPNVNLADPVLDNTMSLMRAMRRTPLWDRRHRGDAHFIGPTGTTNPIRYIVGGFAELTILGEGEVFSQIIWRWPDRLGEPIDPNNEGAPAGMLLEDPQPKEQDNADQFAEA